MAETLPSPEKNPPRLHLELPAKQSKELVGRKPGEYVKLVIVGEITDVSLREPYDPEMKIKYVGSLSLDIDSVVIAESPKNDMAELLDDDE